MNQKLKEKAEVVQTPPQKNVRKALSSDQEDEIIDRLFSGSEIAVDLAREFNVHKSTISRIFQKAKAQFPSRAITVFDPAKRNKRVAEGIAKAAAAGNPNGRKAKLSTETQQVIVRDAAIKGATYSGLAKRYNVNPSTISRIVRAYRVSKLASYTQSLEEIFTQVLNDNRCGVSGEG